MSVNRFVLSDPSGFINGNIDNNIASGGEKSILNDPSGFINGNIDNNIASGGEKSILNDPSGFINGNIDNNIASGGEKSSGSIFKDDVDYFFRSAGIDLDRFMHEALLSVLPKGTNLSAEVEIAHPHIDWSPSIRATRYLYLVDGDLSKVKIGPDLVVTVRKSDAAKLYDRLDGYQVQSWQSVGDLMLVWARDYNVRNPRPQLPPIVPENWTAVLDATEDWAPETSLVEKIAEDGYMCHLVDSEASPYLTQLETD
jgi:hypothetical protein